MNLALRYIPKSMAEATVDLFNDIPEVWQAALEASVPRLSDYMGTESTRRGEAMASVGRIWQAIKIRNVDLIGNIAHVPERCIFVDRHTHTSKFPFAANTNRA